MLIAGSVSEIRSGGGLGSYALPRPFAPSRGCPPAPERATRRGRPAPRPAGRRRSAEGSPAPPACHQRCPRRARQLQPRRACAHSPRRPAQGFEVVGRTRLVDTVRIDIDVLQQRVLRLERVAVWVLGPDETLVAPPEVDLCPVHSRAAGESATALSVPMPTVPPVSTTVASPNRSWTSTSLVIRRAAMAAMSTEESGWMLTLGSALTGSDTP